jgi:hypothetical protein
MNAIKQFIPDILFGTKGICTYCGEEADTIDHVIPIAFYGIKRKFINNDNGVRTYACRSCNSSLGSRVFVTFKARLTHVAATHSKKSKQTKSKWSHKELEELDHNLQSFIKAKKNISDSNQSKTKWIGSPAFNRAIANLQNFKELQSYESCYIEWVADFFKGYFKKV